MKKLIKVPVITTIILVTLICIFLNIPRILTLIYPNDSDLVDNSHLLLKPVSVLANDNGFYDLAKIKQCHSRRSKDCTLQSNLMEDSDFEDLWVNLGKRDQWNQAVANRLLRKNKQALVLFAQAANKNYIQAPDFADTVNIKNYFHTKSLPLTSLADMTRLQAIKATSLSHEGKPDDALKEAVKLNKIGHNIIVGNGDLSMKMIGLFIQVSGADTILQILPYGTPTNETLQYVKQSLQLSRGNIEGLKNGFKFEYMRNLAILNSSIDPVTLDMDDKYKKEWEFSYYYKKNQTINFFTNAFSEIVNSVGIECGLSNFEKKLEGRLFYTKPYKLKNLFTENLEGKRIYDMMIPIVISTALSSQCMVDLRSNIAEIQIALTAYKADNGSLPTNLSDLVPRHIKSIPVNVFDKKPIKYDVKKKILYTDLPSNDSTKLNKESFDISF